MKNLIKKIVKHVLMMGPNRLALIFFKIYRQIVLHGDTIYKNELKYQKDIFLKLGFGPGLKAIDIGAANGVTNSNIYPYKKWLTGDNSFLLMVEGNPDFSKYLKYNYNFKKSTVYHGFISSDNVSKIFNDSGVPKVVDLLSIDIDSYDYYILDKALMIVRPNLIIAEINERFPPEVYFKISSDVNPALLGGAFYGMSLSAAAEVLSRHNYKIIGLFYNNIYAVPVDNLTCGHNHSLDDLYTNGYKNMEKRKKYFHWNGRYEAVLKMGSEGVINFFNDEFKKIGAKNDDYTIRLS